MQNDLISRSALKKTFEDAELGEHSLIECVLAAGVYAGIENAPTIDAVPVVRCRECKHHKDQLDDRFVICRRWRKIMEVDGFCHKGAKMDGGVKRESLA